MNHDVVAFEELDALFDRTRPFDRRGYVFKTMPRHVANGLRVRAVGLDGPAQRPRDASKAPWVGPPRRLPRISSREQCRRMVDVAADFVRLMIDKERAALDEAP